MVEVYFEKELSDIVFETESLDEWKAITEELGISGQIELAKGTKSPVPYPYMNNKMKLIAKTLCPANVSLKDYNKTPIPLEVLKQAKFAINERHFGQLCVWYDDKSPDPFLVGVTGYWSGEIKKDGNSIKVKNPIDNSDKFKFEDDYLKVANLLIEENPGYKLGWHYFNQSEYYLLARWGDHLRDFKELTQMAIDRVIEENSSTLLAQISKLQEKLNTIKQNAPLYINGVIDKHDFVGSW